MKEISLNIKIEGLDRLKQAIDTMQAAIKEIEAAAAEVTFSVGDGAGNKRS